MENIEKQLASFGLNQKEIKVYLACLQLGSDTAFNIARRSGVKRATTYLVLTTLVGKGLITKRVTSKSLFFSVANPEGLITQLENKKTEIETILPSLLALYNAQPEKPTIQIFEGIAGVNQIYKEAIMFLEKNEGVIFYGNISYLQDHPALLKSWLKESKSAQGHIRELLYNDTFHAEHARQVTENNNPRHKVKLLQKDIELSNDNAVFGNKLVIFSTQKTFYAIVIENRDIANTYRTMFNLAWNSSIK